MAENYRLRQLTYWFRDRMTVEEHLKNARISRAGHTNKKGQMKNIRVAVLVLVTVIGIGIPASARAEGKFYFPVGIAYGSGISDVTDTLAKYYEQDGYDVSTVNIPVGLVFNPFYEWETAIGGIGAGVTVGPTTFFFVDETTYYSYGGSSDDTKFSYIVPVGAFVRYTLWPKATVAPYLRVGFKYPFAGGDNFESPQMGVFGTIGIEFWRNKQVGMSLEVGYDTSEITVNYTGRYNLSGTYSEKVTCPGFTVALQVVF